MIFLKEKTSIGIVVSEFNSAITSKMLETALSHARKIGVKVEKVIKVPGAYDMPLAIKKLLQNKKIHGVATLGAIITGETKHDEVIAYSTAILAAELSVQFEKPVALGVSGPGQNWELAEARAESYAKRSVDAVMEMLNVLK